MHPLLLAACLHRPVPVTPGLALVYPPYLEGSILFPEEVRPVAEATAAFLEERGWAVLDFATQDALVAAAAEGRRPGGGACSVPYVPDRLIEHLYPGAETAELRASCEDGGACSLDLTLSAAPSSGHHGEVVRWWSARLHGAPTVGAVVAAVPRLRERPLEDAFGGIGGLIGGRFEGTGVALRFVEPSGPWGGVDAAAAVRALDFDACWADWRRDHWGNAVRVEVGSDGRATRCSSEHVQRLPYTEAACACEVVGRADFGPGEPGRRLSFEPYSYEPAPVDTAGRAVGVTAESVESPVPGLAWAGTGLRQRRMAECLAGSGPVEKAEVLVTYVVDPTGVPESWSATWPAWVDASARRCLDGELARARFGCAQTGEGGEATVTVSVWASSRGVGD